MKETGLTPGQIGSARRVFVAFAILNVMSFTLLSGNLVTLLSLKLGASDFLIGLLSSFIYTAYLFMLAGRLIAPRWGMVRLMGRFWMMRYLLMLPILLAPLFASRGIQGVALGLLTFSVLAFNAVRGIAITAYNPILGTIAAGKDRGAFLARLQTAQQTVNVGLGVAMALVLGREGPLGRYMMLIGAGIVLGVVAATLVCRLPEPEETARAASRTLGAGIREAFGQRTFRRFILLYFLTSLVVYMASPFLVVYIKELYDQPDNAVLFFTVFGSAGAVLMALVSGFMIDRLGAKPLYILFWGILTLVLIPLVVSPPLGTQIAIWTFAALLFFFFNMGQFGILNAGQTYFLSAIKAEDRLNLGVVYFLTLGIAGGIGSLLGGTVLDGLSSLPQLGRRAAFQVYFGGLAGAFVLLLFLLGRMENLGSVATMDALAAIFSPRDLRAISLLNRLSRTRTVGEEKDTIRALAESHSELPLHQILVRLKSPRFTIRAEALQSLSTLPLDEQAVLALISEVKNHPYTTAYLAADILGARSVTESVPALRRALASRDFFLVGKSMVALARLGDRESTDAIIRLIEGTPNPRLVIHGASALEILREPRGIEPLLGQLARKGQPFLRDEILLSLAGILGMGEWFYPVYVAFLERAGAGISLLRDGIAAASAPRIPKELLAELLSRLLQRNRRPFAALATELLEAAPIEVDGRNAAPQLSSAVLDPKLARLERFLFLVAAAIVWNACLRSTATPPAP
jgi:HEAT repeat protein/predicted MFS family arabinose efflux permease